jgi:hypothetical protein|tara:strand:- start:8101 stop:8268 length:168 start_codon:yes stop_codon:yes gene_type:complete
MKYDVEMDEINRKIDRLLSRVETISERLAGVENFVVSRRNEERSKRNLEEEMWTK